MALIFLLIFLTIGSLKKLMLMLNLSLLFTLTFKRNCCCCVVVLLLFSVLNVVAIGCVTYVPLNVVVVVDTVSAVASQNGARGESPSPPPLFLTIRIWCLLMFHFNNFNFVLLLLLNFHPCLVDKLLVTNCI